LFYVLAGALTLTAGDDTVVVPAGASGRLRSDRPYSYRNNGDVPVEFLRTVVLAAPH
jgi:mannose-6-phosphate isomerase-like protein (cupin superfamily)